MVQLDNYNAEDHQPSSFDVLPKGDYVVAVTDSEKKATNAGDGYYIKLTLQVLDGPYKGRKVWDQLNVENPNPKAVQIALGRLSEYCRAVGKLRPADTAELHDVPIKVRLKVRADGQYGDRNEVQSVLWKETTRPDLGAFKGEAPASVTEDDIPF